MAVEIEHQDTQQRLRQQHDIEQPVQAARTGCRDAAALLGRGRAVHQAPHQAQRRQAENGHAGPYRGCRVQNARESVPRGPRISMANKASATIRKISQCRMSCGAAVPDRSDGSGGRHDGHRWLLEMTGNTDAADEPGWPPARPPAWGKRQSAVYRRTYEAQRAACSSKAKSRPRAAIKDKPTAHRFPAITGMVSCGRPARLAMQSRHNARAVFRGRGRALDPGRRRTPSARQSTASPSRSSSRAAIRRRSRAARLGFAGADRRCPVEAFADIRTEMRRVARDPAAVRGPDFAPLYHPEYLLPCQEPFGREVRHVRPPRTAPSTLSSGAARPRRTSSEARGPGVVGNQQTGLASLSWPGAGAGSTARPTRQRGGIARDPAHHVITGRQRNDARRWARRRAWDASPRRRRTSPAGGWNRPYRCPGRYRIESAGGRHRRAAGRSARDAVGVDGIHRGAVVEVLAVQAIGQLVGQRFADDVRPGIQQLTHHGRMLRRRRRVWRASPDCRRR